MNNSGINAKSGLAKEFMQHVFSLHFLYCHDLIDGRRVSVAEHICRRLLCVQKAVKRNCKNPDFDGMEPYERHMSDITGAVHATTFDRHVAQEQKDAAVTLKQDRLNREEQAHEVERRKKKGKDKDKDE